MSLQFHIRVLKFENKTIDASWGSREHCEPFWRMYINKCDGAAIRLAAGGVYPIGGDAVHFVPAWVRFRCDNRKTLRHFYVHFEPIGVGGTILRELFDRPFGVNEAIDYATVDAFPLKNLTPETTTDIRSVCFVTSLVYRAFTAALMQLPKTHATRLDQRVGASPTLAPVVEHIERHLGESLGNDQLAELACMSKSHFVRTFHKTMGQTPADYVQERRVVAAALQLNISEDSIDQIATKTGFANRFYFSRVFRKVMGVSPAAYRKLPTI